MKKMSLSETFFYHLNLNHHNLSCNIVINYSSSQSYVTIGRMLFKHTCMLTKSKSCLNWRDYSLFCVRGSLCIVSNFGVHHLSLVTAWTQSSDTQSIFTPQKVEVISHPYLPTMATYLGRWWPLWKVLTIYINIKHGLHLAIFCKNLFSLQPKSVISLGHCLVQPQLLWLANPRKSAKTAKPQCFSGAGRFQKTRAEEQESQW